MRSAYRYWQRYETRQVVSGSHDATTNGRILAKRDDAWIQLVTETTVAAPSPVESSEFASPRLLGVERGGLHSEWFAKLGLQNVFNPSPRRNFDDASNDVVADTAVSKPLAGLTSHRNFQLRVHRLGQRHPLTTKLKPRSTKLTFVGRETSRVMQALADRRHSSKLVGSLHIKLFRSRQFQVNCFVQVQQSFGVKLDDQFGNDRLGSEAA